MSIVRKLKMSYYLPYEIQSQIMKRLPVKSLVRFKSVSKAWKSFILSTEFIADYNAWNSQHCLLVTCTDKNLKKKHELIVDDDTFPLRKLSHTIPSSVNLLRTIAILGSSQGLFCFYGYNRGRPIAIIWNPSVRKWVDIVVPEKDNWWMYNNVVGFGVCPRTFDPKLVNITYKEEITPNITPMQVEVFTLSSGAWKSLFINLPRKSTRFAENSVDLHGYIYWHAYDWVSTNQNMIMSFDTTSENFTEISLPDSLVDTSYTHLSISKRLESLVVLDSFYMARKKVYKVWMMEGGVQKSFTKIFTIEAPEASIRSVLGFRKSGEPIIEMDNNCSDPNKKYGVYLYEPNSRHISNAGISAEFYFDIAGSCTNTLLLVDR